MSLVRLLPAWLHAIADYAVGAGLIVIALAVGGSGKAVAAGVVVGATVLAREHAHEVPARRGQGAAVHGALGRRLPRRRAVADRRRSRLNFHSTDGGLTAVYIVAGIAVLGVSLITNYQYSDKREWSGEDAGRGLDPPGTSDRAPTHGGRCPATPAGHLSCRRRPVRIRCSA